MERLSSSARSDHFGSKINRAHSPVLAYGVPWLTIILGSLTPLLPIIAPAPLIPPFAFVLMVAWMLLRPGLLPLWAGFPLGLIDDLLSGQPMGCGILLFSLAAIAIDLVERRFPWRSFWQDWLTAMVLITSYLVVGALVSGAQISVAHLPLLLPQLLMSIILFPVVARLVTLLDRARLTRVRRIG